MTSPASQAEAAYVNGRVVTVDDRFGVAEAFAVRSGRFAAVGTNTEASSAVSPDAPVADLAGAMVLPGLIDTHAHTVFRAVGSLASPSLDGAGSAEEITARIAAAARERAPGSWITASPAGEPPDYFGLPDSLREGRWPDRHDLDAAAPGHPVYIPTPVYWPHPAIFNTAALAALGITAQTPDEPGVRIGRDSATGQPTGLVWGLHIYNRDSRLFGRLSAAIAQASPDGRREAIRRAMHTNLAVGVTTIYEGHANFATADLLALHAAGRLPHRVAFTEEVPHWLPDSRLAEWMARQAAASPAGGDWLKMAGVTVSLDGAIQFGAAHMRDPYLDPYGNLSNGRSALTASQLAHIARLAAQHDLRLNIVAAGDAAADITVEALQAAHASISVDGRGWIVQHFHHPARGHITALADMGIGVQTYASVDYSKGAEVYLNRLGGQRWREVVPLRWWLDARITVAQGSDGAHYDPMFQIWQALQRTDGRTGQSLLSPAKAITRPEAIQLQAINGARLLGWDDRLGSIEPGKLADFVMLDRDILRCPPDEIPGTVVTATALAGHVLHGEIPAP